MLALVLLATGGGKMINYKIALSGFNSVLPISVHMHRSGQTHAERLERLEMG
jgi:hypothetical protein